MNTKVKNIKLKELVKKNRTKIKVILLLLTIGLSTKIIFAIDLYPFYFTDKYYLELKGVIRQAEYEESEFQNIIDSAEVSIYTSENKFIEKIYSNELGECLFKLPLNGQYEIKISKKGWVTKIINIDTRLSEAELKKYHMLFEVEMFEDVNELNITMLNQPIANVYFNEYFKNFDFDYRYTNSVNKKIEKVYLNYYKFHRKKDTTTLSEIKKREIMNDNEYNKTTQSNTIVLNSDGKSIHNNGYNSKYTTLDDEKENYKMLYENKEKDNVVYKIQILALVGSIPSCATFFSKCGKANEYFHDGKYKYTLGEFKSFETAVNRLDMMRKLGYNDAFLVAFLHGKRINVLEALIIQYPLSINRE